MIESKADLFESADGAEQELDRAERVLRENFGDARFERQDELGDEAIAAVFAQGSGQFSTEFVVVVWRAENATASLLVTGVANLTVGQVLELARKQQTRIDDAVDSNE